MATLKFRRIHPVSAEWDSMVRTFRGATIFHESAWHAHLQDIHPAAEMRYYEILMGQKRVGVHCGLFIRKFGVPIHGSPLGGTGTNYMGPLVSEDVDPLSLPSLLTGLLSLFGAMHLEVAHWTLDSQAFRHAGFEVHEDVTHLVPLPAREEEAWAALKSSCRNRIRKAQQNGLEVRVATDASVADRFYDQFVEVYGKQGMMTPFGVDRAQSLYRHLAPAARLLPIEVQQEGRTLASGLFPFDDRCIYFWGAASWLREQHLYPNELLHWEVIRFAVTRGLRAYNMCGGHSQFKDKFGGADVPYRTFSRSLLPGMKLARRLYRQLHYARLKKSDAIDASAIRAEAKTTAESSSG